MLEINGGYTNPSTYLNEVDREFIERIENKLTVYGTIPYTVPQKLIIEMIKESALKFYRNSYAPSQQDVWYRLPYSEIISFVTDDCACGRPECKTYGSCQCGHETHHIHPKDKNSVLPWQSKNLRGYAVKLPPFINHIKKIVDIGAQKGGSDELDESDNYGLAQQAFALSSNGQYGLGALAGINQHLYHIERSVKMLQQNAQKAAWGDGTVVPHDFNRYTHVLMINKTVSSSLMLHCVCNVPVQNLYEDDLFITLVYANCKKELKRILGGHTFQLPGDVTLNADEICYGFEDEISKVEEVLKGYNGIGDIILMS